jgi:predicted PurR-regulated permease PerM
MGMSVIVSSVCIISILIIVGVVLVIIINEKNKFKKQIEDQMKNVVNQVNNASSYEFNADLQGQHTLDRIEHDIQSAMTLQEQNTSTIFHRQDAQQEQINLLNQHMSQWRADMGQQLAQVIKK